MGYIKHSIMEFSSAKDQPTRQFPFPFCEIGLMTSNNYKAIQLGSSKPKLKSSNRISKANLEPQLEISQVASYARNICLIDQNKNLWLITYQEDFETQPQNLSLILGKKVNEVFVGEDQIIAKSDNRDYLIYLKESLLRKLPDYILHKVPYRPTNSNPERYTIYQLEQQHGHYFLSHSQKNQKVSLNMAYNKNIISNIETKQEFSCCGEVIGVHFSKYHSVCWDKAGGMYSWGLRSSWIVETSDLIMSPKRVESLGSEFVFAAIAEEYYSVALNREGELIEWGIKNKTAIYPFQRINVKSGFERMISIKGVDRMCISMGISGKVYLWGERAECFINGIPGNRENPTICKKLAHKKISDFSVSKEFIVIVSSPVSELVRRFKMLQINGIKSSFKKVLTAKTNQMIGETLIAPLDLKQRFKTEVQRLDPVCETEVNEDDSEDKEKRDHLFRYIDSRPRIKKKQLSEASVISSRSMEHNKMSLMDLFQKGDKLVDRINSNISGIKTSIRSTRSQIKHLINSNPKKAKTSKFSTTSRDFKETRMAETSTTFLRKTSSYDFRLKQVTERKTEIDFVKLNVLTENTMEKRKLKKEAIQRRNKQELLKMIMHVMMKDWICRVLTKPIIGAKLMIVEQYRSSISFENKVKRFQGSFFKKYIAKRIQALSPYARMIIQNFLARTKQKLRKRREQRLSKSLLTHSVIRNLREKIAHMILLYTFTIKKYQKVARWFKEVKTKKLLALRIKWNLNLINSNVIQFKDANMFSEFRNQEFDELEVQDIYDNFVKDSPLLKLTHFMDAHPIFRINFDFSKKINIRRITVPNNQQQGLNRKRNIIVKMMKRSKVSRIMLGRKTESRDNEFERLKIYPYSQDYDQVIFTRKFNIKVSQNVLKLAKWSQFQSLLLEKLLQHQMYNNEIHYLKELADYQMQMATFIQTNYQTIQIKRSRYLLIPPLISMSTSNKMKRELDKILSRASKQYLIKEHMLEDRHIILDIALGISSCPPKPILTDNLGKVIFKQLFMEYVVKVGKASRLFNVKNTGKLDEILKFN